MTANIDADIRSPWYETFTPPLVWVVAEPAEAEDDASATEAIFDYYND